MNRPILVLGATGAMGRAAVDALAGAAGDRAILAAGRRPEALAGLARRWPGRILPRRLDLGDEPALLSLVSECSVVVHCAGPYDSLLLKVLEAAIRVRRPYVDLADEVEPIREALALSPAAAEAGVTAVVGVGWTPGLTNLAAAAGVARLDRADRIRIFWAGSSADGGGTAVVEHVVHAVSGSTVQFDGGRTVERAALTGIVEAEFPPPIGKVSTYYLAHPEPATLPAHLEVGTIEVRGAVLPPLVHSIARFVRWSRVGRTAPGRRVAARILERGRPAINALGGRRSVQASGMRVEVEGERDGEPLRLVYRAADSMARLTVLPCAALVGMILDGRVVRPGVHPPEAVVAPEALLARAARLGLVVELEQQALTSFPVPEVPSHAP